MAILNNNPLVGASGNQGGYNINNSLRFRSSASAYLNRTLSTPTNNKIFTYSVWVKRGALGGNYGLFSPASSGTGYTTFRFENDDTINFQEFTGSAYNYQLDTTQVFRDPSAWYHLVVAVDTTQATAANRIKLYVNGNQVTAFATATYPTQNLNPFFNSAVGHNVGANIYSGSREQYFDGYMTDINFIDGQALTPSSFGETDTTTGVWKPKAYTGTYGTNGFYLKFSDIATTSGSNAGLGKDFSGNTNYWTTNNISVTSGTTYDAMTDSPTLTSATVANYCVLNPLNKSTNVTVSNANLTSTSAVTNAGISGTMYIPSTGKYYWEATCTTRTNYPIVGIANAAWNLSYPGATSGSYGYANDGLKYNNGSTASYGASYTSGDIIGVAFDADAGTLTFYKNNTSQGTAYTGLTDSYTPAISGQASDVWNMNFGQRPFAYTPPTGFVALNTFNLPTSTIVKGNTVMDATLYTGNGASSRAITNAASFRPDFVWIKQRSSTEQHQAFDSIRGATKVLNPNQTTAETTDVTKLTAFNSDGFSIGSELAVNANGSTYVAWQWQAGQGSTSSNTSGSITSTVSVNTTAGFSVVTYTGTGSTKTFGHGLGVTPAMFIVKSRSQTGENWVTWHKSFSNTAQGNMALNTTDAVSNSASVWGNTAPTSTLITVGNAAVNNNTSTYVCYAWAEIAGFSKFGSYTGNGSTDGVFVYLGFRPKFIITKVYSTSGYNWNMYDSSRGTYNVADQVLIANGSGAEETGFDPIDFLSNGFKLRMGNRGSNVSGASYIYMAFAENPTKYALAR